jgi:hypothetical protein
MSEAEVTLVGSEDNRWQHDMLGIAVSMAAKAQARTTPGEVWVGQTLYESSTSVARSCWNRPHSERGGDFVNPRGKPYGVRLLGGSAARRRRLIDLSLVPDWRTNRFNDSWLGCLQRETPDLRGLPSAAEWSRTITSREVTGPQAEAAPHGRAENAF